MLLEGPPGRRQDAGGNALSQALGLDFRRVQFTPDMLPSDLTGTMTLRGGELAFRPGPVFTNVLLADEINRTPPKTQAALLEAMQERQVTVDGESRPLPDAVPRRRDAEPDRVRGHLSAARGAARPLPLPHRRRLPGRGRRAAILRLAHRGVRAAVARRRRRRSRARPTSRRPARWSTRRPSRTRWRAYLVALVRATRELPSVELGASPRAAVHLLAASKAAARLAGRDFVTPDDVVAMAPAVLRHRLVLRPEAELERFTPQAAVAAAIAAVPVPR